MINLIKPGYVLNFAVDPNSIISPSHAIIDNNGVSRQSPFQTAHLWRGVNSLGVVSVFSHASGALAEVCSVTAGLRTGISKHRADSYSPLGTFARAVTFRQNVAIGNAAGDFVGYTDCYTNYTQSNGLCFSKDFSGCLMVAYRYNGNRYVAHAAANGTPSNDCKQAFLTHLQNIGANMIGWFRPYVAANDDGAKIQAFTAVKDYVNSNINGLTTFGVITATDQAYSITAFKPVSLNPNTTDWVVTNITPKVMTVSFNFP
jgi:hypothetical protein